MGIIQYVKSKKEPLRSYLRSALSWAAEREEVFTAFATVVRGASAQDREEFLGMLGPGARRSIEEAMAAIPPSDPAGLAEAEASCAREAERLEQAFERKCRLSDEVKRRVKSERTRLHSGFGSPEDEGVISDQMIGIAQPAPPDDSGSRLIALPEPEASVLKSNSLFDCITRRKSRRAWKEGPLSLGELSWLLWSTQGLRNRSPGASMALRTVPSAGARHPFETYVFAMDVAGLDPGLWRYRYRDHKLAFIKTIDNARAKLTDATHDQAFVGSSCATFVWTALPYRTEWRYVSTSHKPILLDAGHVCQNLYLACEAIGCGTCAIAAYDQKKMDALIGVDGVEEMTVYLAPVGRARD